MKMCFSIDALSPSGGKAWRLQQDGSWRLCRYGEPLQPGDARITDKAKAQHWAGQRLKKDRDHGLKPAGKAGRFDFWVRGIFAHVVSHYLAAPAIPDRLELETLVGSLEPGKAWLIYLDTEGHFRALDSDQAPIIGNVDIAVRGEIASSPDYVGPRAVDNEARMDELYRQFLAGWLEHLESANLGVFVPDPEKLKSSEDYLDAIRNWRPEH
ncbi:MAG: hypothetical protein D6678_01105 [Zetaproteobacteria bacterium]|nr:MAG: hypothetical protein D6678_01105 [Zetaproteobacteria bacterium]